MIGVDDEGRRVGISDLTGPSGLLGDIRSVILNAGDREMRALIGRTLRGFGVPPERVARVLGISRTQYYEDQRIYNPIPIPLRDVNRE